MQQQVNPFHVVFDAAYRHLGVQAEAVVQACKQELKAMLDELNKLKSDNIESTEPAE